MRRRGLIAPKSSAQTVRNDPGTPTTGVRPRVQLLRRSAAVQAADNAHGADRGVRLRRRGVGRSSQRDGDGQSNGRDRNGTKTLEHGFLPQFDLLTDCQAVVM